ncbi:class I adenylate-forming enzyme family protein [Gordonia terrae]
MNLTEAIGAHVDRATEDRALCYRGTWWTARELRAAVIAIRDAMTSAGVPAVAPVGVYMRNRPGPVAAVGAIMSAPRPLVVLNPANPDDTIADELITLRPPVVIADTEDWGREPLRNAVAQVDALGVVVEKVDGSMPTARIVSPYTSSAEHLSVDPATAILMPTSGTTGPPKRIPLRIDEISHALSGAQQHYMGRKPATEKSVSEASKEKPTSSRGAGVQIIALPSTNISGLWALITAFSGGGQAFLMDRFEPVAWSAAVEEFKPTSVSLPPAALRMLLDAGIPPEQLASLKAVWAGAAPVGSDLASEFERVYGCPVLLSYGATEFTGGITGWSLRDWYRWKDTKRGSVGRTHPGVEIAVVDAEDGRELAVGETGLIQVRSAQASGGNANWVRTNDLGRVDADGFVWIEGRADDVINRGGFKVFPSEVEDCLESHPNVREAVVFGDTDTRLGEVPVAVAVLGEPVSEEDLISWVRSRLPGYKAPVAVHVTDSIPRNAAMKPLRREVKTKFANAILAEPN